MIFFINNPKKVTYDTVTQECLALYRSFIVCKGFLQILIT